MGMPTYAYTTKKAIKSGTGGGSDQGGLSASGRGPP